MSELIHFPSASNQSKLSACPTTKVPQGTDWIYQDFFNQMLNNDNSIQQIFPSINAETTFSEGLHAVASKSSLEWDSYIDYSFCPTTITDDDQRSLPDLDNSDEEDPIGTSSEFSEILDVAPVLIESTISLCTTSTEDAMLFPDNNDTIIIQALKKRKSTSSFRSLKSFISVFSSNKKTKLDASTSKFFQFFKRHS